MAPARKTPRRRRRAALSGLARAPRGRLVRPVLPRSARDHGCVSFAQVSGFTDVAFDWNLENYRYLWDPLYGEIFLRTLSSGAVGTRLTLLLGFPFAYYLARYAKHKTLLLLLVVVPFWTSFLIRTYSWLLILDPEFPLFRALGIDGVVGPALHPARPSTSGSSTPTCRSWCCRSTRRSSGWTGRSSRPRRTSVTAPLARFAASPCPRAARGHRRLTARLHPADRRVPDPLDPRRRQDLLRGQPHRPAVRRGAGLAVRRRGRDGGHRRDDLGAPSLFPVALETGAVRWLGVY